METNPLVSIVIPAFNAERYLEQTFQSVLDQTYSNWEIIIVIDGGSRDRTKQIADAYAAKDHRIIVIAAPHERMGAARNRGIKAAHGEYIAFLDADNLFRPTKLEEQAKALTENPECGISYGDTRDFYDDEPSVLYTNRNTDPIEGDPLRWFLWRNSINLLAVLIRKEVLNQFGAFRGEWPALDDQYLWINLAHHSVKFSHLNHIVGLERLHRDSDSNRYDHVYDTAKCFLEMLIALYQEFSPEEQKKYANDFQTLRKRWRRNLVIGWFMKTQPFAPILYRLNAVRRKKNFAVAS